MKLPSTAEFREWGRPVALVAATYVYFLIFAEFALLQLCRPLGAAEIQWVLGGLGFGGIAGSLLAGRLYSDASGRRHLRIGFLGCALAALAALLGQHHLALLAGSALATGLALGWLTVTLASALPTLVPTGRLGLVCGLGTGLAYALCNLPALFTAGAGVQTLVAVAAGVAGAVLLGPARPAAVVRPARASNGSRELAGALLLFTVLVGLDSAAFNVIQTTPPLKAALWTGTEALWGNALGHSLAAIAAGLALDRGWCRGALGMGAALLLAACTLLAPGQVHWAGLIRILYVAGVSVYSTALVFYPASTGRPRVVALFYALAGWVGSGLGLGLTQEMHGIPAGGLVAAAALVFCSLAWRPDGRGRPRLFLGLGAAGLLLWLGQSSTEDRLADVALGRATYISEGCIHCHSSYVRSRVAGDVLRWGPGTTPADLSAATPPLFGNRRQGPDLARVGNRRSAEWQRLHLLDPRALTRNSRMPSYAHLFAPGDPRGEALVSYLTQLGQDSMVERLAMITGWQPAGGGTADMAPVKPLFAELCSGCHGTEGRGDGALAGRLSRRPPDFRGSPWKFVPAENPKLGLARLIKFGLPGTPMAGHEWLDDGQVVALARYVE
ncbi:MAG: cbb3-type cytochrome c oxidase subunit II, partial [Opitutales bacterium]